MESAATTLPQSETSCQPTGSHPARLLMPWVPAAPGSGLQGTLAQHHEDPLPASIDGLRLHCLDGL